MSLYIGTNYHPHDWPREIVKLISKKVIFVEGIRRRT